MDFNFIDQINIAKTCLLKGLTWKTLEANPNLIQVSLFRYTLDDLKEKGVLLDPMIRKSNLQHFDLNNLDNYVPVRFMYEFFEQVSRYIRVRWTAWLQEA